MTILPSETVLTGQWVTKDGRVQADSMCERIENLIDSCLERLGADRNGSRELFRDPQDSSLWELSFPQGGLQGEGPPQLRALSPTEAEEEFPELLP